MAKEIINDITSIIDDLFENDIESEFYVKRYILSFQDHWLSEKEAKEAFAMLSYEDYIKFLNIEINIVDFFVKLHKSYTISSYDNDSRILKEFLNEGGLIEVLVNGLREIDRFILYVKTMDLVFISGFDQDVRVYFISSMDQKIFIEAVQNQKLHLLD